MCLDDVHHLVRGPGRIGFPNHLVSRWQGFAEDRFDDLVSRGPGFCGHFRRRLVEEQVRVQDDWLVWANRDRVRGGGWRCHPAADARGSPREAQRRVVSGAGGGVGQAHERLGESVHSLGDEFGVEQLVRAEAVHPGEDERFDRGGVAHSGRQPEQRVVVRRPRAGGQTEPEPQERVIHAPNPWEW